MVTNSSSTIIDSSALVAMMKSNDVDHDKAVALNDEIMKSNMTKLLLPYEVLAETLNIIGKKINKQAIIDAGNTLLLQHAEGELEFVSSNALTVKKALQLQTLAVGGPSFVDCLVMAYADQYKTPYIFGFDSTFQKNGYSLPGK